MKKIYLTIVISLCLTLNGCCFLAGVGMDGAKQKHKERSDAFHDSVGRVFDRVSNK